MTVLKLSKRAIDTAKTDRDTFYWDSVLIGFGLKVTATGRKVYVTAWGEDGEAHPVDTQSACTAPLGL